MLLKNKAALVTGSSRGIGAAIALKLAENGCRIAVNYCQNEAAANETLGKIQELGNEGILFKADVANEENVNEMAEDIKKRFGGIDILVNNASSSIEAKFILDLNWEDLKKQIDTAVKGTFYCSKAFAPGMVEKKAGRIINIVSQYSVGLPPQKMGHYVTAKTAMIGLSKSLAVDLASHGVTVNMVSPGLTETDFTSHIPERMKKMFAQQTPLKKNTTTEDVANSVLFLASDSANHITGINLPVCGGMIMM
ncbi:MAG: beta-ketoacyl-ACP reductase [Gammaproteobacteria bacterium]|nr:beta-ketoacyl-ACP reductase [Gammaproteobacteria bacterium]HJP17145.1 3-oxoacyl-ACP reductase family protein [Nitrospinota bacterium]|tara:strand:+ start:16748 stop:17500 length:753 start_codon:yes stop_codon:yes gene_type:complete